MAIESSVVLAGIESRSDFGRLIIEPGSTLVRFLGANEANPAHACRAFVEDGAEQVRTMGDSRSHLFEDRPVPVHPVAKASRFMFDAGTPRGDSSNEIIGPVTSIPANTECVGECRIGAAAPMSDTQGVS